MVGWRAKLLDSFQPLLVSKLNVASPARAIASRLGIETGMASYYYREAHACANRAQYDAAVRACRASIAMRPDNMAAYEVLVQILTHLRRYDDALEVCADALVVSPHSGAISASVTQILPAARTTDDPEKLIAAIKRILTASPGRVDALVQLVELLLKLQRYREVVQVCQRLLEADPEYFPAANIIRSLLKDPNAQKALAEVSIASPSRMSEEYDWLVASNVTDCLTEVMSRFYTDVGVDPFSAPLVQGLERFRRKLTAGRPQPTKPGSQTPLILFEAAWRQYKAGQLREAMETFKVIFYDSTVRARALHNPVLKEAVVRSGEILGRHRDKIGDVDGAVDIYQEIMGLDQNALVGRRLMLLLTRGRRLREAAEFAQTAIVSRPNLFSALQDNPHIASLKAELTAKSDKA